MQGKGLKKIDPARYGTLEHPGDGFSYDIFTQVGARAAHRRGPERLAPAAADCGGRIAVGVRARHRTINGVQPLTHAFDGFFVHSRGAIGLPLVAPGQSSDIAGAISGTPTIFRTDQDVPILDIQTETDVASILELLRGPPTRQRPHFRLWEVAGTAHADTHLLGANASAVNCGVPINNGPMHIVAKAALRALTTWITTGKPPVTAPRIDVIPGATPTVRRDADGIALGGIRTPPVDVPVAALSGEPGPNPSTICMLARFDEAVLRGTARAAVSVARRLRAALRRRRRRHDQGRLRAPRRSGRPDRFRGTVTDQGLIGHGDPHRPAF